jgi:hypothetical protein
MKYTIQETCDWKVEASTPQEALELWLDKGDDCAQFVAVMTRDVFDENGRQCDVEDR